MVWQKLFNNDDIYKKKYKGKYCRGCESFLSDKNIVNGICLDHPITKIEDVEEENYFFKLTKYKDSLLNWINSSPKFLHPSSKTNELLNLIEGIEDISISRVRKTCPWGTIVPGDDNQTIYIWFSALLNYIFAAGYGTSNFNWNYILQTCGGDNLRFQAIIFQAILEALNLKKSDKLIVHGTILDVNGQKMSKTLGNVVDPIEQLDKYGIFPVRYYTLSGLSTYQNSCWSEVDLVDSWNSEIVNDWGNLISRVLHLIDIKNCSIIDTNSEFTNQVNDLRDNVNKLWDEFDVKEALNQTNKIVRLGNKYINDTKPWSSDSYEAVLNNLYYLLIVVNQLYIPVFGVEKCEEIKNLIQEKKKSIIFSKI